MAAFQRNTIKPALNFIILMAIFSVGNSAKLASNGGYDLVFAIEEGSNLTTIDQTRYIENVKGSLQVFSNQLWRATKQRFFVNSVDLVLPSTWSLIDVTEVSASRDYQSADFRLSSNVKFPSAENPNLCGLPGKFVELPLSFFYNSNSNDFGPIWKTLMVLFARYRYGVWEEHGFAGDEKFPYFHQNVAARTLEVTGCNNEPVIGTFKNITDNEDCSVDFNSIAENLKDCRFIPDRVSTKVSTSLMHFHWMDTVVDFCDHTTHNKFAMNKQNIYCDHRSVMEVIQSTPDYNTVTNTTQSIPAIQFKAVKQSSKPIFYLLMDKGLIQGSYTIARELPSALARLFRNIGSDEIVAAVGSYPSDQVGSFVKQEVDWSQVKPNLNVFIKAVGDLRTDGPLERDFSRAILEVAENIKSRSHPGGAHILVVKYGADLNNLRQAAPESEVIVALNDQNIMLSSIELSMTGEILRSHLSQVAQSTYGSYATLSTIGEAEATINNVLRFVNSTLNGDYSDVWKNRRTISKNQIAGIQIPIPVGTLSNIDLFYTTLNNLNSTNFVVSSSNGSLINSGYSRTLDWNELQNRTKFTYRFRLDTTTLVNAANYIRLELVNCRTCTGQTIARVEMPYGNSPIINDADVKIEVTTTSNNVDLSKDGLPAIFVKTTKSGVSVGNVLVEGTAINEANEVEYLPFHDDGVAPDIIEKDGIHSAYILPAKDGTYKISVTVSQSTTKLRDGEILKISESGMGRLLPIDQGSSSGCEGDECTMEIVQNNFMQMLSIKDQVVVANVSSFKITPGRSLISFNRGLRRLLWLAPRVPAPGRIKLHVDSFEVRYSSTQQELLDNFDSCNSVVGSPFVGGAPLSPHWATLPTEISTTYYAMKSVYQGEKSKLSNIFASQIDPIQGSSTTFTPPTTTPIGTGPTTPIGTGPTTPIGTGPTTPIGTGPTTPIGTGPTVPTSPGPTDTTTKSPNASQRINPSFALFLILELVCLVSQ